MQKMYKIGLIVEILFQKAFDKKFNKENINDFNYNLFEINSIEEFKV